MADHNGEIFDKKMATTEDLWNAVSGLEKDMTIDKGTKMMGSIVMSIAISGSFLGH